MKAFSIEDAREKALDYLYKYQKTKDISYLEKAMHLDNTNPIIIFQYLSYLKNTNREKYELEVNRYKYFLDEKYCSDLKIDYINHKEDLFSLIKAIQEIKSNNLLDVQPIRDALQINYSRNDKNLLSPKSGERINNLPLTDIDSDVIFYLSLKIKFGDHLYSLADFKFNDENYDKVDEDEEDGDDDENEINNENNANRDKVNKSYIEQHQKSNKKDISMNEDKKDESNMINEHTQNEIVTDETNKINRLDKNEILRYKDKNEMNNKINDNKNCLNNAQNESSDDNKQEIIFFKNLVSFLKIYSEIIKFFLKKNEKLLVYKIVNALDKEYLYDFNIDILKGVNFYLKEMKLNEKEFKDKTGILYNYLNNVDKEFNINNGMDKYKNLFFNLLEGILKSNCIKQLLENTKDHHNDKDNIISIDDNYIKYIKDNLMFFRFFNTNLYGVTIVSNGKIIINEDFRETKLPFKIAELVNFSIWIITSLHESISHLLKDYYYYLTNFKISDESPKKICRNKEIIDEEGGKLFEKILFSSNPYLFLIDLLYILDIKNWDKNLDDFVDYFNSKKRKRFIKKGIKDKKALKKLGLSKEFLKLLSEFGITEEGLLNIKCDTIIFFRKTYTPIFINLFEMKCLTHRTEKLFQK